MDAFDSLPDWRKREIGELCAHDRRAREADTLPERFEAAWKAIRDHWTKCPKCGGTMGRWEHPIGKGDEDDLKREHRFCDDCEHRQVRDC